MMILLKAGIRISVDQPITGATTLRTLILFPLDLCFFGLSLFVAFTAVRAPDVKILSGGLICFIMMSALSHFISRRAEVLFLKERAFETIAGCILLTAFNYALTIGASLWALQKLVTP